MTYFVRALLLTCTLLAISACGKKGDVKPPSRSEFSSISSISFSFSPVEFPFSLVLSPKSRVSS